MNQTHLAAADAGEWVHGGADMASVALELVAKFWADLSFAAVVVVVVVAVAVAVVDARAWAVKSHTWSPWQ